MTISSTTNRVAYVGNAVSTVFAFGYPFLANGDLKVYQNGVLKAINTHYTVTGAGTPAGGSVTFLVAPAVLDSIVILRDPPITQPLDLVDNDALPAESLEQSLDRRAMIEQRLSDRMDRAIHLPDFDVLGTSTELASSATRANKFLYFDSSGNPTANAQVAAGTLFFSPVTQIFDGNGIATAFTLSIAPGSADAIIVAISGVVQKPNTDFTVSGTTLTFITAPAAGSGNVMVQNFGVAANVNTINASAVSYTPAGAGAVTTNAQEFMRRYPHIRDYGAVCNGIIDDTAAIQLAVLLNPNRTLRANGTPLISSTIFLDGRNRFEWEGGVDAGDSAPPSTYFIKAPTMTTVGVVVGQGSLMVGGGVDCSRGSSGGGIQLRGNTPGLRDVTVFGSSLSLVSGVGIRVGDNIGSNTNTWLLDNCTVSGMSSHGYYFHDGSGIAPNVNAGKATKCQALVNGGKGFLQENAALNTFDTCLSEQNVDDGFRVMPGVSGAVGTFLINCDVEANAGADVNRQIVIDSGVNGIAIIGSPFTQIKDNGFFTKRYDRYNGGYRNFTPSLWGSTGATKTGTAIAVAGTTVTVTSVAHGYSNGQTIYVTGNPNANANGAFVISNVTANTFDYTARTDQTRLPPTTAGGLTLVLQACGTYSTQLGRYMLDRSDVEFTIHIIPSSTTNLTGDLRLILPWALSSISAGSFFATAHVEYYNGITHTGQLSLVFSQNGSELQIMRHNVGSGLVPANLPATSLGVGAQFIISGRYNVSDDLA